MHYVNAKNTAERFFISLAHVTNYKKISPALRNYGTGQYYLWKYFYYAISEELKASQNKPM